MTNTSTATCLVPGLSPSPFSLPRVQAHLRIGKHSLPDLDLTAGHIITFDVSSYFRDPDGEPLRFETSSSDAAVATASASGHSVTVRAVAQGRALLTVTARDPGGLTATQTADVDVAGKPAEPVAVGTIRDHHVKEGDVFTLDVSPYSTTPAETS